MELSTSLNVLWDPPAVTQLQVLERCVAAGFRHLDFNPQDWLFEGAAFVSDDWQKWVRETGRRADELGACFTQAHVPIFNQFAPDDRTRWLTEMCHRAIEAAGMLGIPWIVVHPDTYAGAFDAAHLAGLKQRNLDWFAPLLRTAERAGVGLAMENIPDYSGYGRKLRRMYGAIPTELIELVDAFGSPRVGVCWDTGHANLQGLEQGAAIRALGSRLKALHIQDSDGRSDQHLLPFFGTIRWSEVMAALYAVDYAGDFTYEAHMSIRVLPDALCDAMLGFAVRLGSHMLETPPESLEYHRPEYGKPSP